MKQLVKRVLALMMVLSMVTGMCNIQAMAAACPDSGTGNHIIANSGRAWEANGSSGHTEYARCQACGQKVATNSGSHSYSTSWSGCYYTRTCSVCGYSGGSGYSHSWSSYTYTYKDSSTHTGTRYCTDCGMTGSTSGSHSTTNRYSSINDAQHAVEAYCAACSSVISTGTSGHTYVYGSWMEADNERECRSVSCSLCTYAGTAYRDHTDGNGDGLCDSCNANMNVAVTFQYYGNVSNTVKVRYGSTVSIPDNPVRPGYDFAKWVATNGNSYDFATLIYADMTLAATWKARSDTAYTVNHYQQNVEGGGYTLVDTDHLTGTTDSTGKANERTYAGFHINTESSTMEGKVNGNGTLTLNVYYDRVPLTVSIDLEGKTETIDIHYGETLPVPETPTRPGYDFVFWADGEGNKFDFTVPITGPVTLVATWRPRNDTHYTVKHYQQTLDGDYTLIESEDLSGTTDTIATAVAKSYAGFHEAIGHGGHTTTGKINGDGTLVLTLYYDRDGDTPYTVIHYWQTVDKEGYEPGETLKVFGVTGLPVTAQFKSFTGFHSNEEHPDNKTSGIIAGDGSLVLALYYDRATITVSIDLGEDTPLIQEIPYGGTIPKPDDPTKSGYIFAGWKDENGHLYDFHTPITGDLVLVPSWQVQSSAQEDKGANLNNGETSLPWLYDFGDTLLTRAQAAYILTDFLKGEVDSMKLTTAFDDVSEDTEYAAYISWANVAGIVFGYGNKRFGPADSLTREQLSVMLYRVYGDGSRADLTVYADHDSVSWWAYDAVCWAVSKKLFPVEDNELRPWGDVTGKELAALLEKAERLSEKEQ